MTEYWKSNARKYCDFCKCWIADNKISISFHEGGKRHKENVGKKITELSKKSIKEHRSQKREDAEMRKMEEAALAAYMKDIENNADITSQDIKKTLDKTNSVLTLKSPTTEKLPATPVLQEEQSVIWHEVVSEDGSKYYWNTETNETVWDAPLKYLTVEEQAKQTKKKLRKKKIKEDHELQVQQEEKSKELDAHLQREKMKEIGAKFNNPPPRPIGPMLKPENPFGSWIPVVTKPVEKIDLQLPKQNIAAINVPIAKVEYEKNFKEKQVINMGEASDFTEFKKRKFKGNFKKNSRQRLGDD